MKVLMFMTQFWHMSGAERLAVELAEELNKRGIHADILSMYTEDRDDIIEAKEALKRNGIPSVHFLGMRVHPALSSMIPSVMRLRQLIQKQKYDIIETSMLSPTVLASWAVRGLCIRHVAGLHDVYTKMRYQDKRHLFWRFSVRQNDRIRYYAISNYAKLHWLEFSDTLPSRTRTIYNGIPNDCFDAMPDRDGLRDELGIPRSGRIALFVGRLLKRKGIDTIYAALKNILVTENMYLLYAGPEYSPHGEGIYPDEDYFVDRLKRVIIQEKYSGRIRFLGRRSDIPRLMASSDILVHPARIEGFGLVLAEAMAAGLPIVASNVEGIPEVLEGSRSMMVDPEDVIALRDDVLKLINMPTSDRNYIIEKGRIRANDFRMNIRVNAMIKLFDDVLHERY